MSVAGSGSVFPDADGGFSKPRSKDEAELDITPMIDVTFLLLIFFMVTSTMQAEKDLQVPVAKHGVGVDTSDAMIVSVLSDEPSYTILLGDGEGPEASVAEVTAFVEEGLRENREHVIIKADRDVPHGTVQEVAKAVTAVEGISFSIGVRDQD